MASSFFCVLLMIIAMVVSSSEAKRPPPVVKGLSYTFYDCTCPKLETIIRNHLHHVFKKDITQAAGLLRMHFHDCFVQGCDGSILLDGSASDPSEQNAPPNLTLRREAFKIINDLRALVHRRCGQIVSCADITALVARDSVYMTGGPHYKIPLGRRDSLNFASIEETVANLPSASSNTSVLLDALSKKNFNPTDVVALSGAHTIGRGHCTSFTNRLYPQDPNMNQTFANNLKLICPALNTTNTTVLDILSPYKFDNKYYVNLMNHEGLFNSDQDLYTDNRTSHIVTHFGVDQRVFFEKFVYAMIKMGQLSVLTGKEGEIRANCSVKNGNNLDLLSVVEQDHKQGMLSQF